MSTAQPPALRIKSHWFKPGAPKSAEQQGSAVAFTVWRLAHHMVKRMRGARFDIDVGAPYFEFLREALVFLIAVADRSAHARLDGPTRAGFVQSLAAHCADTLAGNETDLLGPAAAGVPSYRDRFIDLLNELLPHYAEFGADAQADAAQGFVPDFGFVRYFGSRLEPTLPQKDRRWVIDQVMAIEAPHAVQLVNGALLDLLSTEPRRARRSRSLSGD
jgi:hypothetical protein